MPDPTFCNVWRTRTAKDREALLDQMKERERADSRLALSGAKMSL